MNVDLVSTIRLLHRVLGFLAQQSGEQLADIAEGRRTLVLGEPEPAAATVVQSTKPSRGAAERNATERNAAGRAAGRPKERPTERDAAERKVRERKVASAAPTADDFAAAADKLRRLPDVDERIAYLASLRWRGRKPLKADLAQVAKALGVEITSGMRVPDIERKLVEYGLGAKKKFASLSRW
jgi:hypothetical protein